MPEGEPQRPQAVSSDPDDTRVAQLERAHGTWELVIDESPDADPRRLTALRRVLRMKSFEADALRSRLPGPVRRGARVDLEPILERLTQAGLRATLERRTPHA